MESRGLNVPDCTAAEEFLAAVSYFRLSGYFQAFQPDKDYFAAGTCFDHIKQAYRFDRQLRLLVFDAIEQIEVAIRTKLVYSMSQQYGPHFLHNAGLFKAGFGANDKTSYVFFDKLQTSILTSMNKRHPEVFISAFKQNYPAEIYPPAWMTIELLTMGELSELYSSLIQDADRKVIASYFNLHPTVFNSWLHSLNYVRNICGHHARLWNRDLSIEPKPLYEKNGQKRGYWLQGTHVDNRRTFFSLCTIKFMLNVINPSSRFGLKLAEIIKKHPLVPVQYLGIPSDPVTGNMIDWQALPVWAWSGGIAKQ